MSHFKKVKGYLHPRRIEIRPEWCGRIAIHFYLFAQFGTNDSLCGWANELHNSFENFYVFEKHPPKNFFLPVPNFRHSPKGWKKSLVLNFNELSEEMDAKASFQIQSVFLRFHVLASRSGHHIHWRENGCPPPAKWKTARSWTFFNCRIFFVIWASLCQLKKKNQFFFRFFQQ